MCVGVRLHDYVLHSILLILSPLFSPFLFQTLQAKKYEKLGYNTKKGGDRDMM